MSFSYSRKEPAGTPTQVPLDKYAEIYLQVGADEDDYLALVIEPEAMYLRRFAPDGLGGDVMITEAEAAVTSVAGAWYTVEVVWYSDGRVTAKRAPGEGGGFYVPIFANEDMGTVPGGSDYVVVGKGSQDEGGDYVFDNIRVSDGSGTGGAIDNVTYAYDVLGRRVGKTTLDSSTGNATTTYYVYSGDRVIEERDESNAVVASYVYGLYVDEVLQMRRDVNDDDTPEDYYFHSDDLYNTIALTALNTAGDVEIVERYDYGHFGDPVVFAPDGVTQRAVSAVDNAVLFTGRQWDAETGLYDYRTRYYDPKLGRFLSRDSIGIWGDAANMGNAQAYVNNNPWTNLDPFGEGVLTWMCAGDYEASDWAMLGAMVVAPVECWGELGSMAWNSAIGVAEDEAQRMNPGQDLTPLPKTDPNQYLNSDGVDFAAQEKGKGQWDTAYRAVKGKLYETTSGTGTAGVNIAKDYAIEKGVGYGLGMAGAGLRRVGKRLPWPKGWKAIYHADEIFAGGCDEAAIEIQKALGGGKRVKISVAADVPPGRPPYRLGPVKPPAGGTVSGWDYHVVVYKDGRIYDKMTGIEGMTPAEYEKLFEPGYWELFKLEELD